MKTNINILGAAVLLSALALGGRGNAAPAKFVKAKPAANAVLVGSVDNPAALFGEIMAAYRQNALRPNTPNVVKVRPGTYVIPKSAPSDGGVFWNFSGANALHDCTVDLTGVTLVTQDWSRGNVQFNGCTNATFKGATIYEETPSFTQGTLTGVGMENAGHWYMDVQLDTGYLYKREDIRDKPTVHLFDGVLKDKQGRPAWKTNVGYQHPDTVTAIAGSVGKYHLTLAGNAVPATLTAGDRIVFRGPAPFSFIVKDCKNVTFQNLKLGNNGLYGIVEFGCSGSVYDHVQITYGPPPPGATEAPIVATSADGLHSLYGDPGPTITNCVIEGTPDDCIAIHGRYDIIDQALPGGIVTIKGDQRFAQGDPMRIQEDKSGFYADTQVTHAQKAEGGWRYTLADAAGVVPGCHAANPQKCGHGYKIMETIVRRNRARGMLLKADDGLVKHCLVEDNTIAGIVVSPEAGAGEAGYAHNVSIIGNIIRHTGYAETWAGSNQAGALTITGNGSIGNKNITIASNTFENIGGANIEVQDTDGAVITGNRFIKAHQTDTDNGTRAGVDPHALISLSSSRNVRISGNTTEGQGPFGKTLVAVTPTATHVQGAADGVTVKPSHKESL